jgi:glycosyltransferase involved in cell wall biosynthesis
MELTPHEMRNFMRLVELRKKGYVKFLFLQRRLYNSIGHFVKEATFLPYSIDLSPYKATEQIELSGNNIDLFCRPRQGKNILNQMASFAMADIDGKLHINFKTDFLSGIPDILSNKIVYHKWLPDHLYYNLIAGMDLSLQITIGESFNYVACERMCLGVPVLTTKDIYFIADDDFLAKYLCVDAPDTPAIIAKMITYLIKNRELRNELAKRCKSRIANTAKQNNKEVVDVIMQYFHF